MTATAATSTAIKWEVLDNVEAVDPAVTRQWDELAVRLGKPFCAPAWILAWRHLAPERTHLRIVVVRSGERVVAVAPFYTLPWRAGLWTWSLMGSDSISRIEPIADPDCLEPAAAAIREALAAGEPAPARIRLEGLPAESPWPALLAAPANGRRPGWTSSAGRTPAPTIELDVDSVDDYLRGRSPNFRQQMRRFRRKLDADGGEFRVFVAAGGEISYWNGGFDERYAQYKPSLVALVEAIRTSIDAGFTRFDLGPGGHAYKYRFTESEDTLLWTTLIPRGREYLLARLAYAPAQLRHDLAGLLSPETKRRLRELLRRPAP